MIIKKLSATFGGLKNKTLELEPGLNIIEGENESGKSTWCAFLRAMLYGIDSRERDTKEKKAEKNRYRPWSGDAISGRMELELDGKVIIVERGGTAGAPMRDFRAYTESGADAGYSAADFGERAVGASREVFERSAFVSSPPLPSGSRELEKRVLETVSSGDDSPESASAAIDKLGAWQRRLRYNRRGELPALDEQIEKLSREADECERIDAEILAINHELAALRARKTELEDAVAAHTALERADAARRLTDARAKLSAAEAARAALESELPLGAPSADELRRLDRDSAVEAANDRSARRKELSEKLSNCDREIRNIAGNSDAESAERDLRRAADECPKPSYWKPSRALALGGLCAVLAALLALCGYMATIPALYAVAGALVGVGVIVLIFGLIKANSAKNSREKFIAKWGTVDGDELRARADRLAALRAERAAIKTELSAIPERAATPASDRLREIFGTSDRDELRASIDRALALYGKIAAADSDVRAAKSEVAALETVGAAETDAPAPTEIPSISKAEAERELRLTSAQISSLEHESARLEGQLGGRDATLIAAERSRLRRERDELQARYDAIDVAIRALESARESLRERFSPALNAETAKIFSELCGERYSRVLISREFQPEAGDELSMHAAGDLSRGTVDQLWLSLRLAVLHTALSPSAPLVLDDALVSFDDERLRRALELLLRESEQRQVLLFTCHRREGDALRGRGGVKIITL